jgi:adenosylhomocysteine nucleosidase
MKTPFVIITALQHELSPLALSSHIPILYSGIGKINAAIATFKAIEKYQPTLIINFGTVGKINPKCSGLLEVKKVIQRDMDAEPLAPRGTVPFSDKPNELCSGQGEYVCATGDSFVTARDEWLVLNQVDVVDMELYAIASVAAEYGIHWRSFKYISDDANEASGKEWANKVSHGEMLFLDHLKEITQ